MAVKRPPIIEGEIAKIPLTKGMEAIVDLADLPLVGQWSWCASQTNGRWYAVRNGGTGRDRRRRYMHQDILSAKDAEADHVDGDSMNNRRLNLRPANRVQQNANQGLSRNNTSGFKGVCWDKRRGKWVARVGGKHLGYFDSPQDAGRAYDAAATKEYAEFALTNEAMQLYSPHGIDGETGFVGREVGVPA